jgi:WD40 repeat protein
MSAPDSPHPDQSALDAFATGQLPPTDMDAIAAHLVSCRECAIRLEGVDELALQMRAETLVPTVRGGVAPRADPQPVPLPAPETFPGYELLRELGRGGMGIVYLARDRALHRLVALKVVREGSLAAIKDLARFRSEAEALARIRHPHIMQVYEVGESCPSDGTRPLPFFTMQYVPAGSLAQRAAGILQPPQTAARFVELLARAVEAAHRAGVIHRDLKPANVLLEGIEPTERTTSALPLDAAVPKITDFGVAKWAERRAGTTTTGAVIGTPEYIAPEQVDGRFGAVGAAADIHALGAILYELLTGRPPFRGSSTAETLLRVTSGEATPPCQLVKTIPRDLETIVLKCLEKSPAKRFASAAALAEDLRRFQAGEPIRARPVSPFGRVVKWARREPTVAALLGAVIAAVVVGLVLVTVLWYRAEDEAARAHAAELQANVDRAAAEQARAEADDARARAEQAETALTLEQALTRCQRGEVSDGLVLLLRVLELAQRPSARHLDRAIRVNIAEWGRYVPHVTRTWKHADQVARVSFSPDGDWLASVGSDGKVRFWELKTGAESAPPLSHPGVLGGSGRHYLRDVAWSADGKLIATGNHDARARIWDFRTRTLVGEPLTHPHTESVWRVKFSDDGKSLYTISEDGIVRAWDTATRTATTVLAPPTPVSDYHIMALNPAGDWLAAAGRSGTVSLKSLTPSKPVPVTELPHDSLVESMAFTPEVPSARREGFDRRLLVGTRSGKLFVWSLDGPPGQALIRLLPLDSAVRCVAVSPDGNRFATGTVDGRAVLWDTVTTAQLATLLRSNAGVSDLAFHPNGQSIAVGADNGTIHLLELPQSDLVGRALRAEGARATSETHTVAFTATGELLFSSSATHTVVWDVKTGSPAAPELVGATNLTARSAALSPDGRLIAIGRSEGDVVEFFDGKTCKHLHTEHIENLLQLYEGIQATAFSPDSKTLVTYRNRPAQSALSPAGAWVWDVTSTPPQRTRQILQGFPTRVVSLTFAPDGARLALACADGTVRFWDVASDKTVGPALVHPALVNSIAFDPTGDYVVTGCRDGIARVWRVGGEESAPQLLTHAAAVTAAVFSPDGRLILTGSSDGLAQFWESATGVRLGRPLRHPASVRCVCFSPDGTRIATGDADRTTRIWRVPQGPIDGSLQQIRAWVENITGPPLK